MKLPDVIWNAACIHSQKGSAGVLSVAATAIQVNPEPMGVGSSENRVHELTDVIARHSQGFFRIALRHVSNIADAEDAVQDALLSALTHIQQFKGQAKMSTWLTTIVINSARMKLRKRLASVQLALEEIDGRQDLMLENVVPDTR